MRHSASAMPQGERDTMPQPLSRLFTDHPAEAGETYGEHLRFTAGMSLRFVWVSVILFTHGLLPFLFTRTASRHIEKIYLLMRRRAERAPQGNADQYDI